eukprot:1157461-Pelagomonas_calceolata.AAC.3
MFLLRSPALTSTICSTWMATPPLCTAALTCTHQHSPAQFAAPGYPLCPHAPFQCAAAACRQQKVPRQMSGYQCGTVAACARLESFCLHRMCTHSTMITALILL